MHEVDISIQPMMSADIYLEPPEEQVGAAPFAAISSSIARVPVVTAIRNVLVSAVRAMSSAVAPVPVVAADPAGTALVSAIKANATSIARPPVPAGGALVTAVVATSTALALPGGAPVNASVTAIKANGGTASRIPTIDAEAVITGTGISTGSSIAIPPVVTGEMAGTTPVFESVGALEFFFGTAMNLEVPAGMANDDIALAFVFIEDINPPTVIPAGFAEAPDSPVIVGGAQPYYYRVYWKRAAGADTGTYDFTMANTNFRQGIVMRVSGCVTTGSPFDVTNAAAKTTTVDGNIPAVSDTTTGANRLLVWCGSNFNYGTYSAVTGFTIRFEDGTNSCQGLQTKNHLTASATGSLTSVCTGIGSSAAWLGALKP